MPTTNTPIAKAGKLVYVDSGSYSDYSVMGFFVALQDFCPQNELNEYLKQVPNPYFNEDQFLAFLLKKGLLLKVEYSQLHLGGYGQATDFSFTPL